MEVEKGKPPAKKAASKRVAGPATKPKVPKVYKTYESVEVSQLQIDQLVQRYIVESAARKLEREWDHNEIGTLVVSQREDGTYWVIDGQHRLFVAKKKSYKHLDCEVWHGLTRAQEARKFIRLNRDRRAPSAFDEYRVGLEAAEPIEIKMHAQATACGLDFSLNASSHMISAVKTCHRIVRMDKQDYGLLRETLQVVERAYGKTAVSWDGMLLEAVARIINLNRKTLDIRRLAEVVLPRRKVVTWKRDALDYRPGGGGSVSRSIALSRIIRDEYNKRLSAAKRIKA